MVRVLSLLPAMLTSAVKSFFSTVALNTETDDMEEVGQAPSPMQEEGKETLKIKLKLGKGEDFWSKAGSAEEADQNFESINDDSQYDDIEQGGAELDDSDAPYAGQHAQIKVRVIGQKITSQEARI